SVPSDLFTVARTLAVLCIDFDGYQDRFRFTLPEPDAVPLFGRFDSLYRFLLKGTATRPDDRFQSADEMAEQLLGVLREIVADVEARPAPGTSALFTGELRASSATPEWRALPVPQVMTDDAAAGYIATLANTEPDDLVALLRAAPERTVEVELRMTRALLDAGRYEEARTAANAIARTDPWEWRAVWCRGIVDLATLRPS